MENQAKPKNELSKESKILISDGLENLAKEFLAKFITARDEQIGTQDFWLRQLRGIARAARQIDALHLIGWHRKYLAGGVR